MDKVRRDLVASFDNHKATLGVIGLGYVGLPLAVEMARSGYRTVGIDLNAAVCEGINAGRSHIKDVPSDVLAGYVDKKRIEATTDASRLRECDAISICVPTPLNKIKDPDLSYIVAAARTIRDTLRPGQLIILESTTYPGTTREVVLPVLEETGLKVGVDFFLCFSPERVDPGNAKWHTRNTPKVLGGITPACTEVSESLYGRIFDSLVPVESAEAAELVKVYENTFRMINIALANELAQACEKLGIDVWGVIDAAATKPFGFMKFTPGPGLGGHCIPLDPHYLAWKMRTLSYTTRMIELAGDINFGMPRHVVDLVAEALNDRSKALKGARVGVIGVAFKPDVQDARNSPAGAVLPLLQERGGDVRYHDPLITTFRDDAGGVHDGRDLDELIAWADAIVIVTAHRSIDWAAVYERADLVIDTVNSSVTRVEGPVRPRQVLRLGAGWS